MCGPLSVEYMTKVLSAMPRSSSALRTVPTFLSWSIMVSWYGLCQRPDWPMLAGLVWVRKCMWVKFTQTKNGLFAFFCRCDEVHGPIGDVVIDRQPSAPWSAGRCPYTPACRPCRSADRRWVVAVRGFAVHHAARSVFRAE